MSKSEDIQKQMQKLHAEIEDTISRMGASGLTAPMVLQKHAQILDLTSQLAEISGGRLERQTNRLIFLTWALVGLTAVLLVLTFVLVRHG
jgi:hypothetical protein